MLTRGEGSCFPPSGVADPARARAVHHTPSSSPSPHCMFASRAEDPQASAFSLVNLWVSYAVPCGTNVRIDLFIFKN